MMSAAKKCLCWAYHIRVEGGLPLTGAIDEITIFNVVLDENDIKTVATSGLKQAFAVSPKSKLTTTWSVIKQRDNL